MTWLKTGLLLALVAIGIGAIAIYLAFFQPTRYRIFGQYVDYDCSPVANANFEFRASMSSRAPYSGGAQRRHAGTTDARGRFAIDFESADYLSRFVIELSQANDRRRGERRFDDEVRREALDSSEAKPVNIYRQHPRTLERRVTDSKTVELELRGDGGGWRLRELVGDWQRRHSSASGTRPVVIDSMLRWHPVTDGWRLTLTAYRRGGFIEYPAERLPFAAGIPAQGYRKSVFLTLPDAENRRTLNAFYYRHGDGEAYGTLLLAARYHDDEGGPRALLTVHHDLLASETGAGAAPVLMPYSCGGSASRGADAAELVASRPQTDRNLDAPKADNADAQTAADPDTPLDWLRQRLDNPVVLRHALVSHGDVAERYPLIYPGVREWTRQRLTESNGLRLVNWRNGALVLMARDEHTPPKIIETMLADFPYIPIALAASANPALPRETVERVADGLLTGKYQPVGDVNEDLQTLLSLATNPRLGASNYRILSARLPQAVAGLGENRLRAAIAGLVGNPGLPAAELAAWTDWALQREHIEIPVLLLAHPNTRPGDLRRLAAKFWRAENRNVRWELAKSLKNPNLPHDVLLQFVTELAGPAEREGRRVLLHPNFDRQALEDLLTLDKAALIEDLLELSEREPYPENPVAKSYLLPAEVIRHIYELPGAEKFHAAIAINYNTPPDILDELLASNLNLPDWLLLLNAGLPAEKLADLYSRYRVTGGGTAIAENPSAPGYILTELAENREVAELLLDNPATPAAALDKVYRFISAESVPDRRRELLRKLIGHTGISAELMDRVLVEHEDFELLMRAARNPGTQPEIMEKIQRREYLVFSNDSLSQQERSLDQALAANPATPWAIKRKLPRY